MPMAQWSNSRNVTENNVAVNEPIKGDFMKKMSLILFSALLVLIFGGYAFAELEVKTVSSEGSKPNVKKERFMTAIATVVAIDMKTRKVTLKRDDGKLFDVTVGPEVKNLPQIKKGDEVTVKFYEAVSAKVYKAGEAPRVSGQSATMKSAEPGAKPGSKVTKQSTVTSIIQSIDIKQPSVTLKSLEGKELTVKIEDPKLLNNIKVGDEVVITFSEALAISVEKVKKQIKK